MKTATAAALLAIFASSGAALAYSGDYVADRKTCAGSFEKWVEDHAAGGEKIIEERGRVGAFAAYLVEWNDGTLQEVTIGPTTDDEGNSSICILAKQHVSTPGET